METVLIGLCGIGVLWAVYNIGSIRAGREIADAFRRGYDAGRRNGIAEGRSHVDKCQEKRDFIAALDRGPQHFYVRDELGSWN